MGGEGHGGLGGEAGRSEVTGSGLKVREVLLDRMRSTGRSGDAAGGGRDHGDREAGCDRWRCGSRLDDQTVSVFDLHIQSGHCSFSNVPVRRP